MLSDETGLQGLCTPVFTVIAFRGAPARRYLDDDTLVFRVTHVEGDLDVGVAVRCVPRPTVDCFNSAYLYRIDPPFEHCTLGVIESLDIVSGREQTLERHSGIDVCVFRWCKPVFLLVQHFERCVLRSGRTWIACECAVVVALRRVNPARAEGGRAAES